MKFKIVEEMTTEQAEYFKNSKLKRVYYHASNEEFTAFDKGKIGSGNGGGLFGNGFYFAYDKSTAKQYGKYVREFYLNVVNPYEFYSVNNLLTLINKLRSNGIEIDEEELQNRLDDDNFEFDFDPMDTLNEIVLDDS